MSITDRVKGFEEFSQEDFFPYLSEEMQAQLEEFKPGEYSFHNRLAMLRRTFAIRADLEQHKLYETNSQFASAVQRYFMSPLEHSLAVGKARAAERKFREERRRDHAIASERLRYKRFVG
tara:strand:+ start:177 stop:536 length:360 start_codon:yes stop_codon:yes gene_type:complete